MYPASYSPRSRAVEIDDAGLRTRAPLSPATWNLAVQITAPGQTYTVDIYAGTEPEFRIDWGDGVVEFFTTIGLKTHTYQLVKTHTVQISGRFQSSGNIRLGSNAANQARLIGTGVIPFIPGLANFLSTFENTGLRSIPTDLFRYNTQVSASGFQSTFQSCTNLTGSIPTDLFRYNTQVSANGFYTTFRSCTNLTGSIPTNLFRYNTQCTSFNSTFYLCPKLRQNANIFYADGEQSTRFLNQSVDFTNCFRVTLYTGDQGVAPDLWNCAFGTGTPIKTDCWRGHSVSTVSNFANIPAGWNGQVL